MTPVRFELLDKKGRPLKTPNPLNGSFGLASKGAQMANSGRRKQHRSIALAETVRALELAGLPTREKLIPAKMRKGVEVAPAHIRRVIDLPQALWCVEITRISQGRLNPLDGLPGALKSIVDGIADALDVCDEDEERFQAREHQRKAGPGVHGVEVTIGIRAPVVQRTGPAPEKSNSQFNLFEERAR